MEDFISASVKAFTSFFAENNRISKNFLPHSLIVSFALPLKDKAVRSKIDLLKLYERSFYFEKPSEDFLLIGLDEVLTISESGLSRFTATDKKIREWKDYFVNNWDTIPSKKIGLFYGTMKFASERANNEWEDFEESVWFVPEIILMQDSNSSAVCYNFIYNKNIDPKLIIEKFESRLKIIFNDTQENRTSNNPKVISTTGNSPKDRKKWKLLLNDGLENIYSNQIQKIVLSRKVELLLNAEPDFEIITDELRKNYNDCTLFVYHHGKSSFFGATPEKLAQFEDGVVKLEALAGSAPRGTNDEDDIRIEHELLSDKKNINEHNFVIDHIKNSILPFTLNVELQKKCSIRKLANIQHISTAITAKLKNPDTMMNLLDKLYPTPAICGLPKEKSFQLIKKLEGYRRGLYSGIIGWLNFNNEAEFVIAIRSALSIGNKIVVFAGSGIVENSEPDSEYIETELKLKPILSLFDNEKQNKP